MKRYLPEPGPGTPVKVRKTNQLGKIEKYDANDENLTFKLKLDDGNADWFPKSGCKVLYRYEDLEKQADRMRKECVDEIKKEEQEMEKHFNEYIKRLQAFAAGKTASGALKIAVGLIPGAHAISEVGQTAAILSDLKSILSECATLSGVMGKLFDMYMQGHADLKTNEALLLKVVTRSTKMIGEEMVGGLTEEPGTKVLEGMLKVRALIERLKTLEDMSFGVHPDDEVAGSDAKTPEKPKHSKDDKHDHHNKHHDHHKHHDKKKE